MNITLMREVVFKTGLSKEQAEEAVAKARQTPAAKYFEFIATAAPSERPGWALTGRIPGLLEAVAGDPNGFQISIQDV